MNADNVRVLLANRPRMFRESLRGALELHADVEVETATSDPIELLAAVDRIEPDVVFVTMPESGGEPGICSHLLAEYPELLVIALSPVEQRGLVFRRVIIREELEPVAEDSLLEVIRRQRPGALRPAAPPRQGTHETSPRKER